MHYLVLLLAAFLSMPAIAKTVEYQYQGETYQGYFVSPSENAPLVLLVHDWDGLTGYEKQRADMLAEQGYAVFAADLFGKGIRPTADADKRQHTGELYKNRQKMRDLIRVAKKQAQRLGADNQNAIIIGYCFGGAVALEMARSGDKMQAFVSFHGGLSTPDGQDYSQTDGEVLVLHGAADQMISMTDFSDLADQLEQHRVNNEMISYGGADHAFTVFGGDRYHAEADRRSWQRLLHFLHNQLNL